MTFCKLEFKMIVVTGGAGFIGSNFVLQWVKQGKGQVVNFDKLTYAGNLSNLSSIESSPQHAFVQGDIVDLAAVSALLDKYQPNAIVHFAAESHVDRSIYSPEIFLETNVRGTARLLEAALNYWNHLEAGKKKDFRFLHVSTDEVYGSLDANAPPSKEGDPYAPNSPYAASKAASDHYVRAYHHTYGLPTLTTYASNNFGPFQFPEKLIPLAIVNAQKGNSIPLYGDGSNIRNWLAVTEHCEALRLVLEKGIPGSCYNIGGQNEITNKDILAMLCSLLDELLPNSPHRPHSSLIKYVSDRPGHDRRYALDSSKIFHELGWQSTGNLRDQLRQTISWYLSNQDWLNNVVSGEYRHWIEHHYLSRGTP
jgi:dTDP-glucose 4,6-dehydratase